ncbi:MAG TPA: MobF family relaxase [Anaeromyxobacter sp.]|nr:MobF family relaxase [Anaeromyxobacter sp.]
MLDVKLLGGGDPRRRARYYLGGGEDHIEGEGVVSEWQGKGALALGLFGAVDRGRFRELLAGQLSSDGSRTAIRRHGSRTALDLTFKAPKSVSIQALVGGDEAVIRAHDHAVAHAVAAAEGRSQARKMVRGRNWVEDTKNLVVAKFRHETSREGDPHLHTHALVLNLTQRADGKWRAIHNDEIVKALRYLGATYRAELAAELARQGYALRHGREGFFELAHIDRKELLAFSRRRGAMEKHLQTGGLTWEKASFEQRRRACDETRPRPAPKSLDALRREWQARARDLGIDFRRAREGGRARAALGRTLTADLAIFAVAQGARRSVRFAVAHLTERQAVVSEQDLVDVALKCAMGCATLADIEREIERQTAAGFLVREAPLYQVADLSRSERARSQSAWVAALIERGMTRKEARKRVEEAIAQGGLLPVERRYTTQTALEREKRILQIEREGRNRVTPVLSPEVVASRLGSSDLSIGQRDAVTLIATTRNRVVGIEGYAGTGKSHMLDVARRLVEEHGHRLVALAPYTAHVRALRELGVEARTVASFLAAKEKNLDRGTILVLDEAGTVPTRHMDQLFRLAERKDSRVVVLGDTMQTKAIEAGRPFDQLTLAGMRTAFMHDIKRQEDPMLREAVALAARGEAAASLARIREIREIPDHHERRAAIAADYAGMSPEERARTIVLSGTNEARREINRAVRERLGLEGQGFEYSTLVRRDTTAAERGFARNYTPGEFIQPERDYPRAGLRRGALYEVLENGPANRLTVRGEEGETLAFNPMTCPRLSLYEGAFAELAPGDRVRITRNDARLDLANGDRFTVEKVSPEKVTLGDGKRSVELAADAPLHLDHAYATTVHSSQGTTADRVLIDVATQSRTIAKDVYYVAISRARHEARIYTNELAKLPLAIEREHPKHAALDLERR